MKFYYCLFLSLVLSCRTTESDIGRYIEAFNNSKQDFEAMVSILKTENLKVGYRVNENLLSITAQSMIRKLYIAGVDLVPSCQGNVTYELTTYWSKSSTVYFSKDACDSTRTQIGYYEKVSQMIDLWGLGDGWMMWVDYDFI